MGEGVERFGGGVSAASNHDDRTPWGGLLGEGAWLRTSPNRQTVSALAPSHKADLADGACFNDARVDVAVTVTDARTEASFAVTRDSAKSRSH